MPQDFEESSTRICRLLSEYIEFMTLGEHCQLTSFQSDNLFNLIFQADGEGDMSIHSCKVESCAG